MDMAGTHRFLAHLQVIKFSVSLSLNAFMGSFKLFNTRYQRIHISNVEYLFDPLFCQNYLVTYHQHIATEENPSISH
jgi:hypothetical protein